MVRLAMGIGSCVSKYSGMCLNGWDLLDAWRTHEGGIHYKQRREFE